MRIAILDDYQNVALSSADWSQLPEECEVVVFRDHVSDPSQLVSRLADFDAVSRMRERTPLPREVLEKLPRLKLILATGLRNAASIDMVAARELGITICGTSSISWPTVEITWAMILMLFRKIPAEVSFLRAGGWQQSVGRSIKGRTLGIVGLGNMGRPVAAVAIAFGMNVIAWSPNLTQSTAGEHGARAVSKEFLFRNSDAITIHMPLSSRSAGIVSSEDIGRMKKDAFLINTSRMPIVDEAALLEALTEERIGGAGIDVFNTEPLPIDHPYRYLRNVVATPHIGYVVEENYALYYGETVENIISYLQGNPIRMLDENGRVSA
ncbi:D-2-hydroxyacid dehydrogenase family protein [Aquamicrobium ahrensii]|uniref:Phosphoglycerate dehydrogenase-like enzyme n=1 Tax=Aquamicrobium ahrensii TaxID=469551 RepID=A0ABV2KPR6_9HYPH